MSNGKNRTLQRIAYACGTFGHDVFYAMIGTYFMIFVTSNLFNSDNPTNDAYMIGIVTTIILVLRIAELFVDPFIGNIIDKTKTRWGRFKPWVLGGAVVAAVTLAMLFTDFGGLTVSNPTLYLVIFAVVYFIMDIFYSAKDVAIWSMIPAFTESGKERENLTTLARSCAGVGSALITVITMIAVPALGKLFLGNTEAAREVERCGFQWFALIIAVLFVIMIGITCLNIKEKSTVDLNAPSVKQMFRALVSNDQAMTVVITIVLINCSLYITSNLLIYFFKYDIGGTNWNDSYVLFNTFGGAIQILSMMIFYPLLRKAISALKVFYVSAVMAVGGYLVLLAMMFMGLTNVYFLLIPGFFVFAAFGMLTVLTTVFLANTVDYGELKNYRRDESVTFSMQTFVVKLASGVAAMIAALALNFSNIQQDTAADAAQLAAENSYGPSLAILRMTMTILPVIGLLAATWIFAKKYILTDEKLTEINHTLQERRKEAVQ